MAKVPFSKLQASINGCDTKNFYYNKNGEEVYYEVKCYLPLKEKLELITNVINFSIDDNGFYNPMKVKLYMTLEVIYNYTNLSFTEKMKEDPFKLYDILISTGIFKDVVNAMGESEWEEIQNNIWESIKNIYDYRNSIMGILENVNTDYSNLNLDASEIQKKLGDPQNMEFLKDVLSKLG